MRSSLPKVSRRGKVTFAVVGAALLLLIFLNQMVDLWTDWLWFDEVGYPSVFGGVLRTKIWLFLLFGLGVGAFIGGNLYLAFRLRPLMRNTSPEQQALERYRMLLSPRIGLWIMLAVGRDRSLRRPVRPGALAAVAAVPQPGRLRHQGSRSSAPTSGSTSSTTRSGATCSTWASPPRRSRSSARSASTTCTAGYGCRASATG